MESHSHNSINWQFCIAQWKDLNKELRDYFMERVSETDQFIPATVTQLTFEDFQKIDPIIEELEQDVRNGLPSYSVFISLLRKIKLLFIELNPEYFEELNAQERKQVLECKLDFPTEADVDRKICAVLDGRTPLDGLSGSYTFDEKVLQLSGGDEALTDKFQSILSEYQQYFEDNKDNAA